MMRERWLIGVDVGGSGSRVVAVRDAGGEPAGAHGERDHARLERHGERARVTASGTTALEVAAALVGELRAAHPEIERVAGIGVGATGIGSLAVGPSAAARALAEAHRSPAAIAVDAVTAHLGALEGRGGAVVVTGTGCIALATDLAVHWRRVDGWGHLLGDRGSGAAVGMAALRSAMRANDGVDTAGSALLAAMTERLGEPASWPAQLYGVDERAGVLASLVPLVVGASDAGDATATEILEDAGREIGRTLAAALAPPTPQRAAVAGGMLGAGGVLVAAIAETLGALRPECDIVPAAGSPLDGALLLAGLAARGAAPVVPGLAWSASG